MKLDSDDFELFDVPRRFAQDSSALDARWRALLAEVHPDRFTSAAASSQRAAVQWSVRVNEAHQRLKDPLRRAAYLCELSGVPIEAESNTAMPAEFLVRQMEWRESLDDAADVAAVARLAGQVATHRAAMLTALAATLDDARDLAAAARQVRALMFVERFAGDVERRLRRLDGLDV